MEHQFNLKSDCCVFVFILLFYFLNDSKGVVNRALETTLKIDHCENKHDSHHPARSRTRGSYPIRMAVPYDHGTFMHRDDCCTNMSVKTVNKTEL